MSKDFRAGQRKCHNVHDLSASQFFENRKSCRQPEHHCNCEQMALIIQGHIIFQLVGAAILEKITACLVTLRLKQQGMKV
jgi:hypothetical protein